MIIFVFGFADPTGDWDWDKIRLHFWEVDHHEPLRIPTGFLNEDDELI